MDKKITKTFLTFLIISFIISAPINVNANKITEYEKPQILNLNTIDVSLIDTSLYGYLFVPFKDPVLKSTSDMTLNTKLNHADRNQYGSAEFSEIVKGQKFTNAITLSHQNNQKAEILKTVNDDSSFTIGFTDTSLKFEPKSSNPNSQNVTLKMKIKYEISANATQDYIAESTINFLYFDDYNVNNTFEIYEEVWVFQEEKTKTDIVTYTITVPEGTTCRLVVSTSGVVEDPNQITSNGNGHTKADISLTLIAK